MTAQQEFETHYSGPERRRLPLTDDQIEEIAERAAQKAIEKMTANLYQEIGKGLVSKLLTVIGVLVTLFSIWATGKGFIKFP